MATDQETRDGLVDRPSVLEAERSDIIRDLERYLALLTSDTATPIVKHIAAVLANDRLDHLHELDTADEFVGRTETDRLRSAPAARIPVPPEPR